MEEQKKITIAVSVRSEKERQSAVNKIVQLEEGKLRRISKYKIISSDSIRTYRLLDANCEQFLYTLSIDVIYGRFSPELEATILHDSIVPVKERIHREWRSEK